MWKPHQNRQPAPSDKAAKENDMHTKILLPLAALLLGAALPAQAEPTCNEYDPPEYRSGWNVHAIISAAIRTPRSMLLMWSGATGW